MAFTHHTKEKGDLAVLKAAAELGEAGFLVCTPLTEHAPFDLVAFRHGGYFGVQVKFRTARDGVIDVRLRSTWSDRSGVHVKAVDSSAIDVVAVFEPGLGRCLWLTPAQIGRSVSVRTNRPRNSQRQGVHMVSDFLDVGAAFRSARVAQARRPSTMRPPTAQPSTWWP